MRVRYAKAVEFTVVQYKNTTVMRTRTKMERRDLEKIKF